MDAVHKFLLRLPGDIWEKLRDCAKQNGRSVNSEIVFRLRRSFEGWKQ